jgi:Domain of unknown function (DUF4333)
VGNSSHVSLWAGEATGAAGSMVRITDHGAQIAARAFVGLMAVLLAGCSSTPTVKPEGAAQSVVDVVSMQTGFHPTDVSCPSGVAAKVGGQFDCHFTGPEGKQYTANMRITKVNCEQVEFDVKTHPS